MESEFKKFKIEPLEDSRGIYGLEFQNTVGGWFGNHPGDRYQFLVRPDVVKSASEPFLTPELFHTLPLKNAGWCSHSTENALLKLSTGTILKERGIDLKKNHENNADFRKKFWGFRNVAWKLLNSRLNKVYSEALPDNYMSLIRRYPIKYRQELFKNLCREGERAWQLAETFPALALYVYMILNDQAKKSAISEMVKAGAKLKELARAADMPMGFRHFQPATLRALFSKAGNLLAESPRLIDSHAPATVPKIKAWLQAISTAYNKTENVDFAKWTARNVLKLGHFREVTGLIEDISDFVKAGEVNELIWQVDPNQFRLIKKLMDIRDPFALVSEQLLLKPDSLIHRPFNTHLAPHTLKTLSDEWHEEVSKIEAEKVQFPEPWYSGAMVKEYLIEPIVDHVELSAAARRFRNCAGTYSRRIAQGDCFLFTVSNGKKDMAMFEIRGTPPQMAEIKGPCNGKVDAKTTRAARQWLKARIKAEGEGRQPIRQPISPARQAEDVPF